MTTNVDIMARTIFGEARSEPDQGKIAVGWVIMNRVGFARARGSYWWGDTITEVCWKSKQFSCWNPNDDNKRIIRVVNESNSVFSHCISIAKRVISGEAPNPIDGATHYYATYIAPPVWVNGATLVTTIGKHRFYKGVS